MEKDEVKRCIEDPIYFVRKYVKVLDKKSGKELPIIHYMAGEMHRKTKSSEYIKDGRVHSKRKPRIY